MDDSHLKNNTIKEKGAAMRLRLSDMWENFRERMRHRSRLVVIDSETLEEKVSVELSGGNMLTYACAGLIVLMGLSILLIAITPLRSLVPGYVRPELREEAQRHAQIIDSLEVIINQHEQHIAIIQDVLAGKSFPVPENQSTTNVDDEEIPYKHSKADSLLRQEIEKGKKAEQKNKK